MKKIICILGLLFILLPLFADNGYYYGNGFSNAYYKGTTATVRAYDLCMQTKQKASVPTTMVEKLSKEEENFLWGALNKYNYKPGEVYEIWIVPIYNEPKLICLYVEIQKNGSVIFYGHRN